MSPSDRRRPTPVYRHVELSREPEENYMRWLERRCVALELLTMGLPPTKPLHFYGAGDGHALHWKIYQ